MRLAIAVGINLLLTVAQVVGGIFSSSLSLVADALHNFSDAAGLLLALIARRIARRPADEENTFGYGRAEVVGGLINLTAILVIAGYLLVEAATRAMDRPEVHGWTIVIVAGIALVVDLATAALTYAHSDESMNFKAAFLHNLADALASVAVIVSGTLIILYDWYWIDLVATAGISAYIVAVSLPPLKRCIRILMHSTPEETPIDEVAATITAVEGVNAVHHLHIWPIDEHAVSLECRVYVDDAMLSELDRVRERIERELDQRHSITHATIELHVGTGERSSLVTDHNGEADHRTE